MILCNLHTHCHFCDGSGEPREYVEAAIEKGFKVLGFSSHAPIPFESEWNMAESRMDDYLRTVAALKEEYRGRIDIYTGLEIDYFEGDGRKVFIDYPVDYIIGSVHFFADISNRRYYSIDDTEAEFQKTLQVLFNGDIKRLVSSYYQQVAEMIKRHRPPIVGHLDVIKKNNGNGKYFSESETWYREWIDGVLDVIQSHGTIVEVNTGGISRGYIQEPYPSLWILKRCRQREIPVMITSDAHNPKHLDASFDLARSCLKEAGFNEQCILQANTWKRVAL
ncbi:MAG TPA: histidinol-phosphatase HisJ [Bacillota bacterium]|nr:histidinol-phosphatase HisJ [Bacillota bacterium]HPT88186.1 histidinol-phosphatase HisJ [Bacillota bacterium]